MIVPPGSTIGIVGGGQLGRMLGIAAAELGYRVHVFAPESGPANDIASAFTRGEYDDHEALRSFAASVDVITYEFENVDPHYMAHLPVPVRPNVFSLDVSRYRLNEKEMAVRLGGATAPYRGVSSLAELKAAITDIGTPAILKTTMFGYDGKGQARIDQSADAEAAWATIGAPQPEPTGFPAILEGRIDFFAEFSIVLCRGAAGETVVWDVPENVHREGILRTSTVPSSLEIRSQEAEAVALARQIADRLGHIGVLTLEFFATANGPLFNEMAPRVHNSGHWTIEGAVTSQFENHIRAVCGLPLGSIALTAPRIEMENLIGDEVDRWPELLADPNAHLHLYGKRETRPGRKMGHVTRVWR